MPIRTTLGIDTGGTYTDAVILRTDTGELLHKTKTLTLHHDLHQCVKTCISAFPAEALETVSSVCLSTTLATNAVVERRGCREGLILIGGRPEGNLPTERCRVVRGRVNIQGLVAESLDLEEVDRAIEDFRGCVESVAVSGYASVRNPIHELRVKERVRQKLGVPVACAHELTTALGFYDRTVTVDLNAKLIPLICGLMDSVQRTLAEFRIEAPLMVVKGDGTLMTAERARETPIETILSGPAASVIGGKFLSGQEDCLVLDMGGTTVDIAHVDRGELPVSDEGAQVGGWLTRIRAIRIYTTGLGGDSRIFLDGRRCLQVGPRRVIPFCRAAAWFPALAEELREILEDPEHRRFCRNEQEVFLITPGSSWGDRSEAERGVLELLRSGPHTLYRLQAQTEARNLLAILETLVSDRLVLRAGLTPTDLLHAEGRYAEWSRPGAELAVRILADQMGISFAQCLETAAGTVRGALSRACVKSGFYYDGGDAGVDAGQAADYLIDHIFLGKGGAVLGGRLELKKPLVMIGAPARAWSGGLPDALGTKVFVPPWSDVANAVGAAVAQSVDRREILIRFDSAASRFLVFSPEGRRAFQSLEEATAYAKESGRRLAAAHLPDCSGIREQVEDLEVPDRLSGESRFVERRVIVMAYREGAGSEAGASE